MALLSNEPVLRARWRVLAALAPVAGGVALLTYLLAGISFHASVTLAVVLGVSAICAALTQTRPTVRKQLLRRCRVGLVAGVLATIAYDGIRLAIVSAVPISFWPFDVFSRFGALLVGDDAPRELILFAGIAYHCFNGCGFAIAYVLLFRRITIGTGLLWAALLEVFMVSVYPSWLGLNAWTEFLSISVVGHVAYGSALGASARRLLRAGHDSQKNP